jgi:hypothetical protein
MVPIQVLVCPRAFYNISKQPKCFWSFYRGFLFFQIFGIKELENYSKVKEKSVKFTIEN